MHLASAPTTDTYIISRFASQFASISFEIRGDPAGSVTAYLHWVGTETVRGRAAGFGYDRHSAALAAAAPFLRLRPELFFNSFCDALESAGPGRWDDRLRAAGFDVRPQLERIRAHG